MLANVENRQYVFIVREIRPSRVAIYFTEMNVHSNNIQSDINPVSPLRGRIKAALGLAMSIVFLYLAFRKVECSRLLIIIGAVLPGYLILSVAVSFGNLWIRAFRWKIIVRPVKDIPLKSMFSHLMIGYLFNNVLPFRAGELGRSLIMGKREEISRNSALASIVVERGFDLLGMAAYVPVVLMAVSLPQSAKVVLILSSAAAVLFLAIAYLALAKREFTLNRIKRILRRAPDRVSDRIADLITSFTNGMAALGKRRLVVFITAISVFIWFMTIVVIYLRFLAFRLELPFYAAVVTLIVLNFASTLPSSPGQIGVAHFAFVVALALFGVDWETAAAFGLVSHALTYITTTITGAGVMIYRSLKGNKGGYSKTPGGAINSAESDAIPPENYQH